MKVRNGFVSNSSSSSFIVGFSQEPDAAYLKKVLYNDQDFIRYEYGDDDISTDTLVEWILNEISNAERLVGVKAIVDAIGEDAGSYSEYPDYKLKPGTDEYEKAWEEYNQKSIERALKMASDLDDPNLVFYQMEFADEDGRIGCQLEHGRTFNGMPYLQFSHH